MSEVAAKTRKALSKRKPALESEIKRLADIIFKIRKDLTF